jgi:hypothetical protein
MSLTSPNQAAAVDAPIPFRLSMVHHLRRATDQRRSAGSQVLARGILPAGQTWFNKLMGNEQVWRVRKMPSQSLSSRPKLA